MMMHKSFATVLKSCAWAFLLVVFLFADGVLGSSPGFIDSALREITAVFRDPGTQWMACLCLGIYFVIFSLLRCRKTGRNFWNTGNPGLWLTGTILIGALAYTFDYPASAQSINALTLLAGAVLGQGLAVWAGLEVRSQPVLRSSTAEGGKPEVRSNFGVLVVSLLVILLSLASVWKTSASHIFDYRGQARWSGPWNNPNIYGLLMGMGIVLAVGLLVQSLMSTRLCNATARQAVQGQKQEGRSWKSGVRRYAVIIVCLIAAILMGRGLLHSYSRGAWLAAICGLAYLLWLGVQSPPVPRSSSATEGGKSKVQGRWFSWWAKNRLLVSIILASVFVLAFWQFRHTQHAVAGRVFSVGNVNDFSMRNRIAAWEGALVMIADKPCFGFGWGVSEPMYDNYYRTTKVEEGAAVQLNDYFTMGTTLGLPALACFLWYVGLSFSTNRQRQSTPYDWLRTTCRAGAIVLLVGFWFDGGLFNLSIAALFWILLELGSVELPQRSDKADK